MEADIEIMVKKISQQKVSLVIVAPRGVKVLLCELRSLLALPAAPTTLSNSIPSSH